ncbi:MAG: magnesium transporter, partial [Magnetococcales bacterium]|nr:magnesium transporter [Magnetococcales bacterium]
MTPIQGRRLAQLLMRRAILRHRPATARRAVRRLPIMEVVRALMRLSIREREQLFQLLGPEDAARLIRAIPHAESAELFGYLTPEEAAELLGAFKTRQQAEFMRELDGPTAKRIMAKMATQQAERLHLLDRYRGNSAGGLMDLEPIAFLKGQRVGDILKELVAIKEQRAAQFKFYLYVVDKVGRLLGVVSILRLLGESVETLVDDLLVAPTSVGPELEARKLAVMFHETGYFSLPVVDAQGVLIGAVYQEAVSEQMIETAESDALKTQGIIGEELRAMPLMVRSRRRLA